MTDEGSVYLGHLSSLHAVTLPEGITDAGLIHLRGLTNLREVRLLYTHVLGPGLVHLTNLPNLERLGPSASIEELDLDQTSITDASLPILKRFLRLKTLYVRDTKLSIGGIDKLLRAMPALTIYDSPAPRDR